MVLGLLYTAILAVVQGLTEWLPVSSSGHLAILQNVFNIPINEAVFLDVMLHLATVLVVIVVFWKDIVKMIKSFTNNDEKTRMYALLVIFSAIPTGIIGYLLASQFEAAFGMLVEVGIALIVTGIVLLALKMLKARKGRKKIKFTDSLIMGLVQGIAVMPGISRSGSTIATGRYLGLNRESAAKFAFLMVIPAVLGAALYKLVTIDSINITIEQFGIILIGMIITFFVGLLTLKILLRIIKNKGFYKFSYYCFAIGVVAIILNFVL